MRCTRAERDAVADVLAKHYEIGSLDDEEFGKRTGLALEAKFRSDLNGLCDDLPVLPPPPPGPPPGENPRYRTWTGGQWYLQNTAAVVAALTAMAISGASDGHLIDLAMLGCGVVNGLLGWRKSRGLAVFGFVSGLFLGLGTVTMIILTWRRRR